MKRILVGLAVLAAALVAASATGAAASSTACATPASGSYVGSLSIDSANPAGSSLALPAAGQYSVVVCGTWWNGGIHNTDAEYLSLDGNWATHQDGYDIAPYFNGPNFGDLEVNNAFVNWGAYNASHTYSLSGTFSGSLNLSVFDGNGNDGPLAKNYGWYGDNHGSLSADVYRALPANADQCKNGGWQAYGIFKNQGDCVSWVATNGKNPPAGK